jgi:hypothetical protein
MLSYCILSLLQRLAHLLIQFRQIRQIRVRLRLHQHDMPIDITAIG